MVFLLKTTSFAVCESNALLLLRCNLPYGLSPNCLRSVASFDFSSELFSGLHRHFVYSELIWKKWYWTVEKFVFLVGFAVKVFMQSAWELRLVTPLVRRTFFFQVTCHREVQAGLHHLELLLKKQQPRISIQLCGYLQWKEICRGKFLKRINLFLLTNTYNFHISAWCCGEPRLETWPWNPLEYFSSNCNRWRAQTSV